MDKGRPEVPSFAGGELGRKTAHLLAISRAVSLENAEERCVDEEILSGWQNAMQQSEETRGWTIDKTHFGLPRIRRLPGTLNHKTNPPRKVVLLENNMIRYNPSDFEHYRVKIRAPRRQSPEPISNTIPAGKRNTTLASLAGIMRRRGMGYEPIVAALMEVNNKQCTPPLERDEVETIARSITQYEPGMAGNEPDHWLTGAGLAERVFMNQPMHSEPRLW